jgi:bacteriochlorophyll 4-vinyl reductase
MVDAVIGRLLVASLHQGIADMAPARLPFYEHWLSPPSIRDRRFGLAPLHAVLSFLRLEGEASYQRIMTRAGQCSADWMFAELASLERSLVRGLPASMRARAALHLSRRLVSETFRGSRARVKLRKGSGTVDIRASVFCALRDRAEWPLCVFYSAAVERFLQRFDLDARAAISQCQALGGSGCTTTVTIGGRLAEPPAAEAA